MMFSDLPSPAEASTGTMNDAGGFAQRETGTYPASSAGQAFSASCSRDTDKINDRRGPGSSLGQAWSAGADFADHYPATMTQGGDGDSTKKRSALPGRTLAIADPNL
jgi:hypothetical protein